MELQFTMVEESDSNLIKHAKVELAAIGYDLNDTEEGPNKWMMESVLELIRVFSKQGHSGFSAPECISLFTKLASFKPLCPLKGTDDEWCEVSENLWQNKRYSAVFKNEKDEAYDINGKVFIEPDGMSYTSNKSVVFITFPYTPKTEYVKVDSEGNEIGATPEIK